MFKTAKERFKAMLRGDLWPDNLILKGHVQNKNSRKVPYWKIVYKTVNQFPNAKGERQSARLKRQQESRVNGPDNTAYHNLLAKKRSEHFAKINSKEELAKRHSYKKGVPVNV